MPRRRIPDFKTDEEAAEWWDTHDLTDYEDELEPVDNVTFGPLRIVVSLRFACEEFKPLRLMAAAKGIDVETLLHTWIAERVRQEQADQTVAAAPPPAE
ncbi:MAG: hypothetical protein FJX75_20115 [Armatimonadetes bacterium]|nr:hypothetical protein [Armatimonadota bacterium]